MMTFNGIPVDGRWHTTWEAKRPGKGDHYEVRQEKLVTSLSVEKTRITCSCGKKVSGVGTRAIYGWGAHLKKEGVR